MSSAVRSDARHLSGEVSLSGDSDGQVSGKASAQTDSGYSADGSVEAVASGQGANADAGMFASTSRSSGLVAGGGHAKYKGSGSEMVWGSFTGEINGKGQTAEYSGEAEAASAGGGFVRASSGGAVTAQQGQVTAGGHCESQNLARNETASPFQKDATTASAGCFTVVGAEVPPKP
ncbi:hypothetical protein ACKKBG_A34295 [Auxenochlorella protothecoides x Auxenochlorella symbiontica]